MTEDRLIAMIKSWGLGRDEHGTTIHLSPPAHIAREQVLELVAEVRRLREALEHGGKVLK